MRFFKRLSLIWVLVLGASFSYGQPAVQDEFDAMLKGLLSHSVAQISVSELQKMDGVCLLDAREKEEYDISHIEGAMHIGYKNLDKKILENIPKEQAIVLYCSVGYRSEKIGEKLQKMGYTNVYNLYGSIFAWVNEGKPVVDKNGITNRIHTYNKRWSKWLKKGEAIY